MPEGTRVDPSGDEAEMKQRRSEGWGGGRHSWEGVGIAEAGGGCMLQGVGGAGATRRTIGRMHQPCAETPCRAGGMALQSCFFFASSGALPAELTHRSRDASAGSRPICLCCTGLLTGC